MQQNLYRAIDIEKPIYFIGIGGIGMSGIAQLLFKNGYSVLGSDVKESFITKKLRADGIPVFIGHNRKQIPKNAQVVYSSAIKKGNPEFDYAVRESFPLLRRAELLSLVMENYYGIAICGSHGKTTTSSMIAKILEDADYSPVSIIGGIVKKAETNLIAGSGKYLVAEADESDGSFEILKPQLAVISNIDFEHIDHYGSYGRLLEAFDRFSRKSADKSIVNCDDNGIKKILSKKMTTVGKGGDYRIKNADLLAEGAKFELECRDGSSLKINLSVLGMHNIVDAALAAASAKELGVDNDVIADSLNEFDGVKRRITQIGNVKDILVIDDYGHHPTEIAATLSALKSYQRRLIVLFQPHRFTRTKLLFDKFPKSFELADQVYVTDIYSAGEQPIKGVNAESLARKINEVTECRYIGSLEKTIEKISELVNSGDLLLCLGAGDIGSAPERILENLEASKL